MKTGYAKPLKQAKQTEPLHKPLEAVRFMTADFIAPCIIKGVVQFDRLVGTCPCVATAGPNLLAATPPVHMFVVCLFFMPDLLCIEVAVRTICSLY
jgi:hypothetical protein